MRKTRTGKPASYRTAAARSPTRQMRHFVNFAVDLPLHFRRIDARICSRTNLITAFRIGAYHAEVACAGLE
jgi:hypothetical protein